MKRILCGLALAFIVALGAVTDADAKLRSTDLDSGTRTYADTLNWSNGDGLTTVGTELDTIIGTAGKDTTTTEITLANLRTLSFYWDVDQRQGTAGGTQSVICSLQVSIDKLNWVSVEPVFSTASSADFTGYKTVFHPFADTSDVGAYDMARIGSARFGRLKIETAGGAADTVISTVIAGWSYNPLPR